MRTLLLEDDFELRESLVELLNSAGFIADGVSSLHGYQAWVRTHSCDLLIVDRSLPDGDGLDALRHHKKTTDGFAIVLSAYSEVEDRVKGFEADADLYLPKPFVFDELKSILSLFQRKLAASQSSGSWIIDPASWTLVSPMGNSLSLTRTQVTLLSNFVERPGIPVTKEELIRSLGGSPDFFDSKRLEATVRRLKQRVSARVRTALPIDAVYGVGYSMKALLTKK